LFRWSFPNHRFISKSEPWRCKDSHSCTPRVMSESSELRPSHTCRCEELSLFTSESRRTHFLPRSLLSTLHSCFILSSLAYSSPFHTITTDATTRCWARITLHSSLCSTPLALTCPTSSYGHCTYTALYHPLRYTTDLPFSLYTVLSGLTHWLSSSLTRSPHVESGYK